ncbi:DNA-binding domain-containing protein, AraC-type [Xenococcus sp. PCC 7305]|uniref:helix-turn-helix transcriptional regulator n=1 Tax=Xenococcus sp. PCC 7305 TaxID=102125 RepID=UPI0002AC6401|nr:AraC family transcriptional regulator [Xenococcus sp. PCC 7305]ELS00510.1 DNA-binding domain-containing protein, AraC-type [Xenococcus sp. PCC 7305]
MKTLSTTEFALQLSESMKSNEVLHNVQGFDKIGNSISKWHEDNYKEYQFDSGVEVTLDCETIYRDYSVEDEHNDFHMLVAKFYLSGSQGVISPGIENVEAEYSEASGNNYLFYLPDIQETDQFVAGTRFQRVRINIEPSFLRSFVSGLDDIPKKLQPLIEGDLAPSFHCSVGKVTPMMRTIIQQMWAHPYQGAIAKIYLEGKVLELLALQLSQLLELERVQPANLKLNSRDLDSLHQAKNILQHKYLNPPSVIDLAQQVGLNRIKLQQGFRQVFQTTPFGYLQNYRLDLAKILLQDDELTVNTVARRVGYSNVSYFSRTFKRRFGITPGKCR